MGIMDQINLAFNNQGQKKQIIPDNSIKSRELTSPPLIPSMFCLVGTFSRKVPNFAKFVTALTTWKLEKSSEVLNVKSMCQYFHRRCGVG